ncbi:regulatory protein, tetR family [Nocardioides scoriae]|uniref:Regulatory protein, tetR family n=1 Tax=Nocardioides scoriae TaxID=642780 RepID=A0A1H1PTC7_9ACTN|nr:TetR/AcrR family transcriptional regulator [Nocardioides scoriae]SDS14353.1 regulatory protein, tetR family [Nocardioides scoriae]
MPDPVNPRRYRSAVREEQAAATRRAVLAAAQDLFASRGYADTAVAEVARVAGVSLDTVYASVGRKPALLLAVHDRALSGGDDALPAEQRDYVAAVRAAAGARAKLTTYAGALAERYPATAPLAEALRVAAQTEAACGEVWTALGERRLAGMRVLAGELRATGELRTDLADDDVAQLLWTTGSPELYLLHTSRRTPEQYAETLADLWVRTLLG